MDRVGRFESLTDDLAEICGHIGIPFDGWLPRAKASTRDRALTYQDLYTQADRDLVARRSRREIDHLRYRFDAT